MSPAERGLTLLEVLAAVALLGILYTALAATTSQGIWNEFEARQRLEASLVADEVLSLIELDMRSGVPLERRVVEDQIGDFVVVTELFDWAPPGGEPPAPGVPSVFGDATTQEGSVLVQVTVRVIWSDGADDHELRRVGFGFDRQLAATLVGGAAPGPGIGGSGAGGSNRARTTDGPQGPDPESGRRRGDLRRRKLGRE